MKWLNTIIEHKHDAVKELCSDLSADYIRLCVMYGLARIILYKHCDRRKESVNGGERVLAQRK